MKSEFYQPVGKYPKLVLSGLYLLGGEGRLTDALAAVQRGWSSRAKMRYWHIGGKFYFNQAAKMLEKHGYVVQNPDRSYVLTPLGEEFTKTYSVSEGEFQ